MVDPRIERLAQLVIGYSLGIKPGQVLRIDGAEAASPLMIEMHRAALAAGAHAYAKLEIEGALELMLRDASEEQIAYISPIEWREIEHLDALATIWSETNTRALTHADAGRHQRLIATNRRL